ncbi:MAG: hypothetical protein VX740_05090 [Pseudomonadota bacterium]|jgi:hypothetical protein|nr:hypothetical protein [Pseudomonadota bacterium]MEC9235121.1 hypothetical protein [Pseudomonadota bacterium]MED5422798.1 hypothetical protein [Pseudomonadota bacterium]MEE3323203.1 hypothetical protein [Pseudomonadota bacterium]
MENTWRIALAEQNMDLGAVDRMVFGKDTCHSFLALINPQNEIVAELHGTTYYPETSQLMRNGQSAQSYMGVIASSVNLLADFEAVCRDWKIDSYFPRLKVVNSNGSWRTNLAETMQTVMTGTKHEVMTEWLDACALGRKINDLDTFYTPISYHNDGRQNCNAVTRAMLHAMDAHVEQDVFHMVPHGYENNIWTRQEVGEFDTRGQYSEADMDAYLTYVKSNISRHMPRMVDHELDYRAEASTAAMVLPLIKRSL